MKGLGLVWLMLLLPKQGSYMEYEETRPGLVGTGLVGT